MEREAAIYFRDQFRQARALTLRDEEAFDKIIFVVERMGMFLTGKVGSLKTYTTVISKYVKQSSPLAWEVSATCACLHIPFKELYDLVQDGRNWAMHQGASARHLTNHATKLAIVLEDVLMSDCEKVRDFMVQNPVCAEMWQPLSFIRQRMLESSFSFLPVNVAQKGPPAWRLISDLEVARYLRAAKNKRNQRLLQPLDTAYQRASDLQVDDPKLCRPIQLDEPVLCQPDDSVRTALEACKGLPVLVTHKENGDLLGIVTAFDLL